MIGDKKTRIILSSGTYPGLSEALFKYVAEIHKGAEVSIKEYVCALVAEWCLNDEISKGKAYNLDEIEGIQKFIESLPGEIKQNIVKL